MRLRLCLWGAVLALSVTAAVLAQQPPPPAAAPAGRVIEETVKPKGGVETSLWGMWVQGGWCMYPIGALSILAVALAIYGFRAYRSDRMLRSDLVPQLQEELANLNWENAKTLCQGSPCLLTNTLAAGLDRIKDGVLDVASMEKAMEEASVQETTAGMKPISYLSITAQLAPLWGLLGTVSGMIKAFQKIGLGGMGKPELLADNIGEAMITTAAGLLVAIPALFIYFYLKNRYLSIIAELSRILGNLSHTLVTASRRQGAGGV